MMAVSDVTPILEAVARGDQASADELLPLVYQDLRKLAALKMAGQAPGHTLQPTALVHEAWLRLAGNEPGRFSPAPPSLHSAHKCSYLSISISISIIQLAHVSDPLAKQVEELAWQEKVSVAHLVSIPLASQVSVWRKRDTISERGKRGSWEKFDRVMAKVRDVPPLPGDEK